MTVHPSLTSDTYLREVLPAVLSAGLPPERELVIQFVVADGNDLFYRLGPDGLEVVDGLCAVVDLTLSFRRRADAVNFARSSLDVGEAVRTHRLKIQGNEEVLPWLAERIAW